MLRITKLTDYATIVLTALAARWNQVCSAAELAELVGLETPTVSKLLKSLAQAGLVESLRGVRGGYRLARLPQTIALIEIVEAMEGPLALTECSHEDSRCGIAHHCGLQFHWRQINEVIADALRAVTLAQLLHPLPVEGCAATHARTVRGIDIQTLH